MLKRLSLHNKSVIITGASSGLGMILARDLARQGARMTLAGRDETALSGTRKMCEYLDVPVQSVSGDITQPADCQRLIEKAIAFSDQIDALVLNAGISMWARFEEIEEPALFDEIMRVNYLGAVNLLHYALPHLKKSRGIITCISSIQGRIGVPYHTAYVASKHALQGFFDSLRCELRGSGVHILMVYPSWLAGTQLRTRALGPSGNPLADNSKNHNSHALPVETCAQKIIKAMMKKRTRLTIPAKLSYLPLANLMLPRVLDYFVSKKVERQL